MITELQLQLYNTINCVAALFLLLLFYSCVLSEKSKNIAIKTPLANKVSGMWDAKVFLFITSERLNLNINNNKSFLKRG